MKEQISNQEAQDQGSRWNEEEARERIGWR